MRTPKPNEMWFNRLSKTAILFKDTGTYTVNFPFSELLPGDAIVITDSCLIAAHQLTIENMVDGYAGWVVLSEVEPNRFMYLLNQKDIRKPKDGELWFYQPTGGYYAYNAGTFTLVFLRPCRLTQNALLAGVRITREKYIRDDDAANGVGGWRFESENWKNKVFALCQAAIDNPSECIICATDKIL